MGLFVTTLLGLLDCGLNPTRLRLFSLSLWASVHILLCQVASESRYGLFQPCYTELLSTPRSVSGLHPMQNRPDLPLTR